MTILGTIHEQTNTVDFEIKSHSYQLSIVWWHASPKFNCGYPAGNEAAFNLL